MDKYVEAGLEFGIEEPDVTSARPEIIGEQVMWQYF